MKAIPSQFEDRTFTYTQLSREGMIALYSQTHKASQHVRYEVIKLSVAKEHTWPAGNTTPEHEAYPSSSAWGRDGFTFFTRDAAETHMRRWVTDRQENGI